MTADDIVAGKAGFQKADLMDYGSLYGSWRIGKLIRGPKATLVALTRAADFLDRPDKPGYSRFSMFHRNGIGASITPARFLRKARLNMYCPVGIYGTNSKARCWI
jgi:hypothetical protein